MACEHLNFEAHVAVGRLTEHEGGDPHSFVAEVTVQCAECGEAFGWRGVPAGVRPDRPTRDPAALELRAPLLTPTELAQMGSVPGVADDPPPATQLGYGIRQQDG